jgi:hypothetical protein
MPSRRGSQRTTHPFHTPLLPGSYVHRGRLLLLGDLEYESERLTLPHPQVTSRRFVLVPLLELDPSLSLPGGTSLAAALAALGDGERVERAGSIA